MSMSAFAIKNYRFVIVMTVAAVLLGIVGFQAMPRQEDPTLSAYFSTVTVIYPGATAEEVEDRVLEPVEQTIWELEEVKEVKSTATEGTAIVNVEFGEGEDVEKAYDLMVQRLAALRADLPEGVVEIDTRQNKPSNVVLLQVAVHGPGADDAELKHWAEELEDRLRTLPDAKAVAVEGAQEQQAQVMVDPASLAEAGLSLTDLVGRVAAAGGEIPGGIVHAGDRRLSVKPSARLETLADVENIVLNVVDGRPVLLGSVAAVAWGSGDPSHLVRTNGEPAVLVTLTLKDGRNVFHLRADAEQVLTRFRADLPAGLTATVVLDQSQDVKDRLHGFWLNLLQGGLVIALVVALLAGWRPAAVVITAMLLSIGISFGLMNAWGIALQQMSIAGLVVVLGLLVDNAIVVVESIVQHRRRGLDAVRAAIVGTDRVAAAVASSTITTLAAFLPMMRTAGTVGEFTRDIPRVVSLVLVVSLAVAVAVTPLLATRLFGSAASVEEGGRLARVRRTLVDRPYARLLDRVLRRPWRSIALVLAASLSVLALAPLVGMNFFPAAEKPVFLVRVHTPEGTSLQHTRDQAIRVEAMLLAQPEVAAVTTNVGDGNPVMYYNHQPERGFTNTAELVVTVERSARRQVPALARRVREEFDRDPDMVVQAKVLQQGPPVGLPVSIEIVGPDLARLRAHADELETALRRIPGAINVEHDLRPGPPRLDLRIDAVKTGKLGLGQDAVAREVRIALAGVEAAVLRDGDQDRPVVVRVAREGDEDITDLDRLRLPLPGGEPVPLAQLTSPDLRSTYARINHTDLERAVIVGSDVDGRLAADIVSDLLPAVRSLELSPQERWRVIGEDEERDRAFLSMLQNVILALAAIYGILVLQFRSFRQPLVIFTSIPVALGGSVLGLLVGGWPFGFTAFIGLLALTGIVVNNAIVLVDQINRLRGEGRELVEALRESAESRLQPILMTTMTTVAGLMPLTLAGDSMWGPMGWVIVGGLVMSTGVTLLMVPALYLLMERRVAAVAQPPVATVLKQTGAVLGVAMLLIAAPSASSGQEATPPGPEPITLEQALTRADAANADLAAVRWSVDAAAAMAAETRAARWPSLRAGAELVRTDDPSDTFGAILATGGNPLTADSGDAVTLLR
ncbi:MAG: efflux RND transporter permease subunit, partial [Candidatus Krumholzibacteriia bacterium]